MIINVNSFFFLIKLMHVCLGNILLKLFYLFSYQEEFSTCKYQQCHGNQNPKFVMCF